MYPTLLLLISQYYGAVLPVELVKRLILMSRPVLPFKEDLISTRFSRVWDKRLKRTYDPTGVGFAPLARIYSMERAIQKAVLEMGLPCCPMSWEGERMTAEEAIAVPEEIRTTRECKMTRTQRDSQVSSDLKVLTIEYMRKLVEIPRFVHMRNLINFDGVWVKCRRTFHPAAGTKTRSYYLVEKFVVICDTSEWENMYPNLYGQDGWCWDPNEDE